MTRSGVPTRPSRSGSSPAQRISVLTASSASSRDGRRTRTGSLVGIFSILAFGTMLGIWSLFRFRSMASVSRPRSIEPRRLLRRVEGKGGNPHQEIFAARRFHLVIADHEPGRRRERAAAGVFEALAGREDRLFADDPRAADFLQTPETVGDPPMAVAQLHGLVAAVFNQHVIGADVLVLGGRGMLLQIERPDRDFDRAGDLGIHGSRTSRLV